MAKLFSLALEELASNDIIEDEVLDTSANPDTALELTDIETATEEFNQCRDELYSYVLAMEEATETVEKLTNQIARNNELISLAKEQDVSDVDMAIATEAIHTIAKDINYNGLDGIRLSQEGFKSNIERLQVANEASEGMISSIIKAIKEFFVKIINMIKKLYIKFMSWLNIYDKKLISLKKDFHNVLYKGKVLIDTELLLKVFNLFPFIKSSSYEVNDLKSLFQDRLQIAKWVEHLNPKNIDKTIDDIVNGNFIEKQKTIPYIDAVYERLEKALNKSGKGEYAAVITSFKNGNINYVSATKGLDHKLTLGEIKTETLDIANSMKVTKNGDGTVSVDDGLNKFTLKDTSISSRDFSDMADYTSKNLTSNLKEFNDNILKLQSKCKDILDKMSGTVDESVKNNLKTIQYLGGRISVDMCLSIMDSIKNYIKAMVTIHSECVTSLPNYRLLIECYNKYGYDASIGYVDPISRKLPYIWSAKLFQEIASEKGWPVYGLGGFVWPVDEKEIVKVKYLADYVSKSKELGMDIGALTNCIHINNTIPGFPQLCRFVYYHEMGHAVMDQKAKISDWFYRVYGDPSVMGKKGGGWLKFGMDEQDLFNYTENPIEVQADAFATLMCGGNWKDRFYGLSKILPTGYVLWCRQLGWSTKRIEDLAERYKIMFERETANCKEWANAGCIARLKTIVKNSNLFSRRVEKQDILGDDCFATIQGVGGEDNPEFAHTTVINGTIVATGARDEKKSKESHDAATKTIGLHSKYGPDGQDEWYGQLTTGVFGALMNHPVKDSIGRGRVALIVWSASTPKDRVYKTIDAMGLNKEHFNKLEDDYYRKK